MNFFKTINTYFIQFSKSIAIVFFLSSTPFVHAQNIPVKVACIGNSVTYGYGLKDREKEAYPVQLQQMLGSDYIVQNFGISGTTLLTNGHRPFIQSAAFPKILAFAPDIAIIHLGLNDTDPHDWPDYGDQFMADYAHLIDTIRNESPAVRIFICKMTPIFNQHPRFKSGTRDWYWEIQQQIPEVAKANKTGLIDFHKPFYSRPDLFPDALHPNNEGASILAKTVYQKITGDFGGLQLPEMFTSHMVLQREKPIKFYGTANRNDTILIKFDEEKHSAITDDNGKWQVSFSPMKAGGPFTADISTTSKSIHLDDILIGDVWLCSGQSNMAFKLQSAILEKHEMKDAQNNPRLRLLNMHPFAETENKPWDSSTLQKVNELQYFRGSWQQCDSLQAKEFSAVAYFFGKKLQKQLNVPIGLIQIAVGGSPAESWIDRYTMEHDDYLVNELYDWRNSDFFMPWVRERANLNLKNSSNPNQRHPYQPSYNWEAGIADFTSFPIKGVIWYQGESNAHNIELYQYLLPVLVSSWRKQWGYEFPFYYVQLSSLDRPSWTSFRIAQSKLLNKIPNSGMAVSSDVGDSLNVHPRHKKEVGDRLARLALHFTYGRKEVISNGPIPGKAKKRNEFIVVSFQNSKNGLKTKDGKVLRGFYLRNERGEEKEVNAFIENENVIIPLSKNEKPSAVLYGWKPFTTANLVNKDGIPASTFKLKIDYP